MAPTHHGGTDAYSEDLRRTIVGPDQRGVPTIEVARTFGVGISSVKRHAKVAPGGGSLRPKRSPGKSPKADERAGRLLEADLGERPANTLSEGREYLRGVAGPRVSVEGRRCELLHLPLYSSDLCPTEQTFAKLEGRLRAAAQSRS